MVYLPDLNTRQQIPTDGQALSVRIVPSAGAGGAFGVMLANAETTVVEMQFPYGIMGETVNLSSSNGGYCNHSGGLVSVSTGPNSNGYSALESKASLHYIAGTGGRFKAAGYFVSGGLAGTYQELGIGDSVDGYFFGYSGSLFGVMRRANGGETWISQASWSLDPMDGTGPSKQTIDPTKGNVYSISYQWLGFGAITYMIEDAATGMICPVHRIQYANANIDTSVRDANLPLRIAVQAMLTASVAVRVSSMAGACEGAVPVHGLRRSDNDTTAAVSGEVPLMSIMNSGSFNGRVNRMRVKVDCMSVASRDNTNLTQYRLVQNATLTGASWSAASGSNSPVSVDKAASTLSGGRQLLFLAVAPNGTQFLDIGDHEIRLAPGETITLTCSGSNSTCLGGLGWLEEL